MCSLDLFSPLADFGEFAIICVHGSNVGDWTFEVGISGQAHVLFPRFADT